MHHYARHRRDRQPERRGRQRIEKPGSALVDRGEARFELARTLLASGADESRALAVARQAEQELAQSGPLGGRDLDRARKWLRRFPP